MTRIDEGLLPKGAQNWYRSTRWNREVELAFLQKIQRARSSWDQYFAIQMFHLLPDHPEAVLRLAEAFDARRKDDTFSDGVVWMHAASAQERLGNLDAAEDLLLRALDWQERNPQHIVNIEDKFVYFVGRHGSFEQFERAMDVADSATERAGAAAPVSRYLRCAGRAFICAHYGASQDAAEFAQMALGAHEEVAAPDPQNLLHGAPQQANPAVLARLKLLASSSDQQESLH